MGAAPNRRVMATGAGSARRRYGLVLVGAGIYTCLTFVWFSLPAYLSRIIAEIGLSGFAAGILAGAVPLTYIPLALVSGLVVDRVGADRSLAIGLVVIGLAQVARSQAPGFAGLLVATLAIGVGGTAVTFGLPKLVATLFPAGETGRPSSLYLLGSSAGTAAAFALGRPVFGPALGGWRALFLWSGVVCLAYAVIWAATTQLLGPRRQGAAARTGTGGLRPTDDLKRVLAHRELRLVVVVGTVYLLVIHGLQGWLPTILEARGLPPDLAGAATSLLVGANVVGILLIPGVSDRRNARREAIVACGGCVTVGLAGLLAGGIGVVALGGVVLAGLGVGGISPLVRAIPPELDGVGPERTGAAVGFVFAVGEVGGFLGPVLIGALHDLSGSFAPGLAVVGAGGLLVIGAGTRLRNV